MKVRAFRLVDIGVEVWLNVDADEPISQVLTVSHMKPLAVSAFENEMESHWQSVNKFCKILMESEVAVFDLARPVFWAGIPRRSIGDTEFVFVGIHTLFRVVSVADYNFKTKVVFVAKMADEANSESWKRHLQMQVPLPIMYAWCRMTRYRLGGLFDETGTTSVVWDPYYVD